MLVGFASPGSFSSRFTELVGEPDQDRTRDFYVDKLGFQPKVDANMGE